MSDSRISADYKRLKSYIHLKNRPKMQTKWKDRINNTVIYNRPSSSYIQNNEHKKQQGQLSQQNHIKQTKSIFRRSSHNHNQCQADRVKFNLTSSKLYQTNFKHHDISCCVCESCTCGRHLCKLNAIAPDLSKSSVYQQSYSKKQIIPNIVNHDEQYPKLEGPHLQMNSTQRKDYMGKKGDDVNRPIPQDLIKIGGPCSQLTSYNSGFPGYHGQNQYIKPTNAHTRGKFPLKSHSTYSKAFRSYSSRPASSGKNPDNFKHGQLWLGGSSYNNYFKTTNPQNFPLHVKVVERLQTNPNYKYQYSSTYRNDYLIKNQGQCPAKIKLESKMRGMITNKKGKFNENSDFKAMTPDFHALSMSQQIFT